MLYTTRSSSPHRRCDVIDPAFVAFNWRPMANASIEATSQYRTAFRVKVPVVTLPPYTGGDIDAFRFLTSADHQSGMDVLKRYPRWYL